MSDERTWPHVERRTNQCGVDECGELYRQLALDVERLQGLVESLERCVASVKTAFTVNDLGKPDFDGHRRAHNEMVKAAETMSAYKNEGAKSVVKWVVGVLLAAMLLGAGELMKGVTR